MASVKHLGGDRWKVTISLGHKAGKGYARTYRTVRARNITSARREAQALEADLRQRAASLEAERATLADVAEAWWAVWSLKQRSPTTADGYRRILDQDVIPGPLGGRRIRELRPGHFDTWYLQLGQPRVVHLAGREVARKGLSPSSVRKVHAVVRQVLDHAERHGWLLSNPASKADLPEGRPPVLRTPTVAELLSVLLAAHARHPMRARALLFAARTRMRRGEVAGVRWSRCDLTAGRLTLDQNVVRTKDEARHVKGPKGRRDRKVALDEGLCAIVEAQQDWQRASVPGGMRLPSDPWLWSSVAPYALPPAPRTLSGWMAKACADAGVAGVRLHDLRHFGATTLFRVLPQVAGASPADVQKMLGHAQLSTTLNTYVHYDEDDAMERALLEAAQQFTGSLALPPG